MDATGFIAAKLRFKGKIAMVSIAISFLVMILAVAISSGFRKEIRRGVSSYCGDIQLTSASMNYLGEDDPVSAEPDYLGAISSVSGVQEIKPVVYRAGIVKQGESIHGVLFKGVKDRSDTTSLGVSIPSRLSSLLGLEPGDEMLSYFVGEKVKARKFKVMDVYPDKLELDGTLLVYASLPDMQRLNGWSQGEVSALEVMLDDRHKSSAAINDKAGEIGAMARDYVATSMTHKYPQLFDWLNLLDFNVVFLLVLMTLVAGFNMISGLLILLFQNISTIGLLKSMGMTDRNIASVFRKVSSVLVLKGMAVGNLLALLFCLVQNATHLIKLNPVNYFVSYVPTSVNVPMILLADLAAYIVIMILLMIPSLFISKVDPAQTVRAQ